MRPSGSLVHSLANAFVSRMHFDLCFLTGAGLTAGFGLSNGTDETAAFQRTVLQNSPMTARDAIAALCEGTNAEPVQCIGNRFVIYRAREKDPKIVLP